METWLHTAMAIMHAAANLKEMTNASGRCRGAERCGKGVQDGNSKKHWWYL